MKKLVIFSIILGCLSSLGLTLASCNTDGDTYTLSFHANGAILRPEVRETTSLGAALLAGLAVGLWTGTEEVKVKWKCQREFKPQIDAEKREALLKGWHKAVERAWNWEDRS